MRPIHLVQIDKMRPAVILTRAVAAAHLYQVVVAPITSRARGLSVEVEVGPDNGLARMSVINCDSIANVDREMIGRAVGYLSPKQDRELAEAIRYTFDLL